MCCLERFGFIIFLHRQSPEKMKQTFKKKKKKKKKKNFAKEPPYMGMRFCRKKFEICDSHGILQKNHSFLFISHLIVLLPLLIAIWAIFEKLLKCEERTKISYFVGYLFTSLHSWEEAWVMSLAQLLCKRHGDGSYHARFIHVSWILHNNCTTVVQHSCPEEAYGFKKNRQPRQDVERWE
jgi:hypothetical protein